MRRKIDIYDIILLTLISIWALIILFPFINVIVISFTTMREFLDNPLLLWPKHPTFENYQYMIKDGRVALGYISTFKLVALGVPYTLFLTTTFAYGMSRPHFPGRKLLFYIVLCTMLFNGGLIPMYLLIMNLGLINSIWALVLPVGVSTWYMIIMRNFFSNLPDGLIESAKLDGAGEWTIFFRIVLPLSLPIVATVTLFFTVGRWNEWFNAMIYIRRPDFRPLQLILRAIVIESQMLAQLTEQGGALVDRQQFTSGIKMACVLVTMGPIMCLYPFLQKHFTKGFLTGAIKE